MTSKRTNHANAKESTPVNQLRIDGFIETQYYRIVGEKGTVDVTEFTTAFATNSYYKSGAPIARHRDSDFFLEMKGQANVDFSCAFADYLIAIDRELVTDRVAFFHLMRAYLSPFTLVDNDGKEYNVKSVATFYKEGYFSVTHLYSNLNMTFCDADLQKIYNWENLYCVRFDPIVAKILKLKLPEETKGKEKQLAAVGLPIEEFRKLFNGDKFGIGKQTVVQILKDASQQTTGGKWDNTSCVYQYYMPYSYLVMRCSYPIEEIDINNMVNILSGRDNNSFLNSQICDIGVDITAKPNTIMRIYRNFLYTIHQTNKELNLEALLFMFNFTDACLIEKIKYLDAIKEMRDLISGCVKPSDDTTDKLLDLRKHQLTTTNDGYLYEYRDEHSFTIKALRKALGIEDYKKEYEHFCNIAEELIIKQLKLREERTRNRQSNILAVLTLILTIPSVTILVDIFYGLEMTPLIYFPQNFAKLIWCTITLIVSMIIIFERKIKQFIIKHFNAKKLGGITGDVPLSFKSDKEHCSEEDSF